MIAMILYTGSKRHPLKELKRLNFLRKVMFGSDRVSERLQKVLTVVELKTNEYLVVGGYAVGYYGYPLATGDLEIRIALCKENAAKIIKALKEFGFNLPELTEELFLQNEKVIRMGNPPMRLEILTSINGVSFNACFNNRVTADFKSFKVNFISKKDLLN